MFYNKQKEANRDKYKRMLNGAASISKISKPRSIIPQIDYRHSERIFCVSFEANDLASKDISIDAYKASEGIGIKTFQSNANQKIAEFNDRVKYPAPTGSTLDIAKTISQYRNMRLNKDIKNYDLSKLIYHFTFRKKNGDINIFEQEMTSINLDAIYTKDSSKQHIVKFSDGVHDYGFNSSKSTLYMKFNLDQPSDRFQFEYKRLDIDYLIDHLFEEPQSEAPLSSIELSLYSQRDGKVNTKSGLNQWNAGGRIRHHDEVYIPIPKRVHNENPGFFPPKDQPFRLKTDDGKDFLAKVCQSDNKALMTNPNRELGKWLLRDKLKLTPGTVLDRQKLDKLGFRSVEIGKYDNENFNISVKC